MALNLLQKNSMYSNTKSVNIYESCVTKLDNSFILSYNKTNVI